MRNNGLIGEIKSKLFSGASPIKHIIKPGTLIHEFHNTVSLIRTIEILLGLPPMNQLDASAPPIDIFRDEADLRPYQAVLPDVALDNLIAPPAKDARTAYWMKRTEEQNLSKADQADAQTLNQIIWFSVRGDSVPMPRIAHLPAFDLMMIGLKPETEEDKEKKRPARRNPQSLISRFSNRKFTRS